MISLDKFILYLKHFSFIAFLVAMVILYSSFHKYSLGTFCLIVSYIYIIITFIMMFIKNKNEETGIFNNLVICFLHIHICYIAYRYYLIKDFTIGANDQYFKFNFLMISICMTILCFNKILIASEH